MSRLWSSAISLSLSACNDRFAVDKVEFVDVILVKLDAMSPMVFVILSTAEDTCMAVAVDVLHCCATDCVISRKDSIMNCVTSLVVPVTT